MRTMLRGKATLLFMTLGLLLAVPAVALADDFRNNLDATFDANFELLTLQAGHVPAQTQTVNIVLQGQGSDGEGGCNVDAGEGPVTVKAKSSNSSVASVKWVSTNTDTVNFTDCAAPNSKNLLVTAGSAGSANVTLEITNGTLNTTTGLYTVSSTGSGTYDVSTAQFTVNVTPPPNTPPTVSVTGVTNGAIYDKGAVPAAGCSVSDAEDTGESATPVTDSSALDSDGLGSEKVTCSYTDGGGLTTTASATYTIRDPSAPVIGHTLNPAAPDGSNGWYKNDVTLTWNVSDPQSPNSLQKTGCVDQNITADQAATTYSCSATSAGGSAGPVNVSIKRDGTAPDVTLGAASGTNGNNGWYKSAVTQTFNASDATSGLADPDQDPSFTKSSGANEEGQNVNIPSGPVSDNAGNTASASAGPFKIDLSNPEANCDDAPTGWSQNDVNIHCQASDAISGLANNADADFDLSTSVPNGTETANATTDDRVVADAAGRTVTAGPISGIKVDKKAPVLTDEGPTTTPNGDNGWYKSAVTNGFKATDGGSGFAPSGDLTKSFTKSSGTAEGSAVKIASGAVSDAVGNSAASIDSAAFPIDLTDPTNVAFEGGPAANGSYDFGDTPDKPTCKADDAISGFASCDVTGYSTAVGSHTMTATAKDKAGRTATATRTYTVKPYTLKGFYQPVDMGDVLNTVKNGSTVPVKFELFKGTTELTSTSAVSSILAKTVSCAAFTGDPEDAIETVATGGTSLRYDATGGQFIYNWQTPKKPNTCYNLTMTATDGSTITAYFKLK
jgi:hypothetical protein